MRSWVLWTVFMKSLQQKRLNSAVSGDGGKRAGAFLPWNTPGVERDEIPLSALLIRKAIRTHG